MQTPPEPSPHAYAYDPAFMRHYKPIPHAYNQSAIANDPFLLHCTHPFALVQKTYMPPHPNYFLTFLPSLYRNPALVA